MIVREMGEVEGEREILELVPSPHIRGKRDN